MAGHMEICLTAVQRMAQRLTFLGEQFSSTTQLQQAGRDAFGASSDLARALDEVSENWEHNRKRLTERILAVRDMAQGTVDTLTEVDQRLAEELAKAAERSVTLR